MSDKANILRIVAETDGKTHVFIFAENSSENNKQQQNKNKDLEFTKGEWRNLKGREYTDKDNLEISVIKVNKLKSSIKVTVEKQDIQDAVDSTKQYHEVTKQCVDKNGQYIDLENKISKLFIGKTDKLEEPIEFVLRYIKKIHDHYQGLPYGDRAQEASEHGFVAGIFNNFRYRENAHVLYGRLVKNKY